MTTDPGMSVVQVLTQQLEHAEPDLLRHKTWPSSSSPCGAAGDRAKTPNAWCCRSDMTNGAAALFTTRASPHSDLLSWS